MNASWPRRLTPRNGKPAGGAGPGGKARAMRLPPIDPEGPSLFTAVREQLGLKLDSQKGPVDIVVVDRAERPKGN